MQHWFSTLSVSAAAKTQAEYLLHAKRNVILLGPSALNHPQAAVIRSLAHLITQHTQGSVGLLNEGANAAGAWLTGTVPHRGTGGVTHHHFAEFAFNAQQMLEGHCQGFVLLGVEPEYDCADSGKAIAALTQAECVVALTAHVTPHMKEYADVILPITPFAEMAGTFVNCEGHWQAFQAAVPALGESRPAWKVLRVLANLLEVSGFQYQAIDDVQKECVKTLQDAPTLVPHAQNVELPHTVTAPEHHALIRIADTPLYAVDPLVRRSSALQATHDAVGAQGVRMNHRTAAVYELSDGEHVRVAQEQRETVSLPVVIDERIPEHSVYIANSLPGSIGLGAAYTAVTFEK